MKSAELARLAGVTVRSLRHYHQLGILAEPQRDENGYRHYSVSDLFKVVRIKNLASAGVSLREVAQLLQEEEGVDFGETLRRADKELAKAIERLNEQRALIALALETELLPDMPGEALPLVQRLMASDTFVLDQESKEALPTLINLMDFSKGGTLDAFIDRVVDPALNERYARIWERFERLTEDSDAAEIGAVIEEMEAARGVMDADGQLEGLIDTTDMRAFLTLYAQEHLNSAQRIAATAFSEDGGRPTRGTQDTHVPERG
ncbi:MAG: MerR family transcriptional regulator [Coriobacteriales bacterium]|nr:MerR family transcriptional regulator [Coriobacteriales bacterium]